MRLLNVIQCTNLGGMEQASLLLMKGLKTRGHEVELISLHPPGSLGPLLEQSGIPIRTVNYEGRGGWRSLAAMIHTFRSGDYDAVLLTGHNFAASAALAAVPAKRKVMAIHYHHFEPGKSTRQWPWIYGLAEHVFDTITFCTDFIRNEAISLRPSVAKTSLTVPNPFAIPPLPSADERLCARNTLALDTVSPVIGNCGWLMRRKRFDVFLDVAALVLAVMPEVYFVIAGDGPERATLKDQARRLGIDGRVRFLGWQADLTTFYKSIDILLFNSDLDALGRTPAEAAGFGIPVVASVVRGGLQELFCDGIDAILLDRHDVNKLSEAVASLITNHDLRNRLAAAGRARVAHYGDLEAHVDTFERLLSY